MRITSFTNPRYLYKSPNSTEVKDGQEQLSLFGHVVSAGVTVTSVVREAIHYGQLMIDAIADESSLPLQEKILRADMKDRAITKYRRTYSSFPAPPLGDDSPMKELPSAQLKRPFMMVPGWDMAHDRFLTFTSKLTEEGQNGGATFYLRDGEFFADRDCREPLEKDQIPPDSKVFVSVFNELGESPEDSAPQIAANLRAMRSVTGHETPDILAYSQGGLATRRFLDTTDTSIGKLLMLGTPNRGAGVADLSKLVYNAKESGYNVDFIMQAEHLDPDDEKSIRFMATDSPKLASLNSRWDHQMAQTAGFKIVGSGEDSTLHSTWPFVKGGDTMVEAENLAPVGVETHLVGDGPWVNHRDLPYSAQVYLQAKDHFDW
jgi:pimeloyl-ACP methyl ester carboxylesterase